MYKPIISAKIRLLRKQHIIEFMKEGGSVREAGDKFNVSESYICLICRKENIVFTRSQKLIGVTTYKIISDLFHMKQADVAKKYRVTPQYVNNIYDSCIKAGIPVK